LVVQILRFKHQFETYWKAYSITEKYYWDFADSKVRTTFYSIETVFAGNYYSIAVTDFFYRPNVTEKHFV